MKVYKDNNDDMKESNNLRDLLSDSLSEIGFFVAVITIIIIAFGVWR